MSLETWIDEEGTSSWVHGSDQLGVLDILKGKLALIIPMLIVSVLSEKSNGTLGVIRITHWHVHVIHEVDELVLTNWSECLTSFLFKQLLQVHLKQVSISIEVEVYNLLEIITIGTTGQLVQKTFDNLSLTTSCKTYKDWAVVDLDELFHQVRGGDRVDGWDGIGRDRFSGINGTDDIGGGHLVPVIEFTVFNVNIVIEDCSLTWEFDDLPFFFPPVGEFFLEIFTFLLNVTTTDAPDTGEHEDVFKTFNLVVVDDVLEQLAHGHNHADFLLGYDVLEGLGAME